MRAHCDIEDYSRFEMARRILDKTNSDWTGDFDMDSESMAVEPWTVSSLAYYETDAHRLAHTPTPQCVLRERQQPRTLLDALIVVVREGATRLVGVTSAYVKPDGREFIITGPEWTEALSEAGANLAVEIQERLAPTGEPYIDGGFVELDNRPVSDWLMVYP